MGRFINADGYVSTGEGILGHNMFAYCGNNPAVYMDPTGCRRVPTLEQRLNALYATVRLLAKGAPVPGATVDPEKPPTHPDYVPPKHQKGGNQKVKNPNGAGKGWPAKDGGVWVPDDNMHGGAGWTVQYPDGSHKHAYPSGHVREATRQSNLGAGIGAAIVGLVITAVIIIDDFVGGFADDPALSEAAGCFVVAWDQIQGEYYCEVCGETWKGW